MKAKDLLKEIVKAYPDVVAIAQDKSKDVYFYYNYVPTIEDGDSWHNLDASTHFVFEKIIEWEHKSWKKRIVTINDLKDEEL